MKNIGLLVLRLTVGTLVAGHGAQKLFGWFEGPGLKGTHDMMESMGMRPGKVWGTMAAGSEFNGGVLTALGLLNPLGPLMIAGTMMVAIRRAHWGKPIWAMKGGAELPLTNAAAATCIALAGSGRYSLDSMFGIRTPRWLTALTFLGGAFSTYAALQRPEIAEQVLEQVSTVVPISHTSSTGTPDLEVETRPATEETESVSV